MCPQLKRIGSVGGKMHIALLIAFFFLIAPIASAVAYEQYVPIFKTSTQMNDVAEASSHGLSVTETKDNNPIDFKDLPDTTQADFDVEDVVETALDNKAKEEDKNEVNKIKENLNVLLNQWIETRDFVWVLQGKSWVKKTK